MTQVTLSKQEDVDGTIFFLVAIDGLNNKAFINEGEAKAFYDMRVQRVREGYPKTTILEAIDIAGD